MSDLPTPPVAGDPTPQAAVDNAAFAKMRIDLENERKARQASEAKLQDLERAKLDETERLRLEVQDRDKRIGELSPIRDAHGKFQSKFEAMYQEDLAGLPDDKREAVKRLTEMIPDASDRYEALRAAKSLLPTAPAQFGTQTQPTGGTPPGNAPPRAPLKPGELQNLSWTDAVASRAKPAT